MRWLRVTGTLFSNTLLVTKHNVEEQEWHIFSPRHCIQVREQSSVRAGDISVNTIDQVKV